MRYLIVGAGGTGAMITAFMAAKGFDVTAVARGRHLEALQTKGLLIHKASGTTLHINRINAVAQEEIGEENFDVIFVCVKAYSIGEIVPLLQRCSTRKTAVIPVLNSMETGRRLRAELPGKLIFDGCIYITGYISAPGEITQNHPLFIIIYGIQGKDPEAFPIVNEINNDLQKSDILVEYSSDIYARIFEKISFTSAFGAVGAYYHVASREIKNQEPYHSDYHELLCELQKIQRAAGFHESGDLVERNMKLLMSMDDHFTTSMMKDMEQGHPDEREQLIFSIVRLSSQYHVEVPLYLKIAKKFGFYE